MARDLGRPFGITAVGPDRMPDLRFFTGASGFLCHLFTVVVSWLRKETRIGPKEFIEALELGAKSSILIIVTCATVGFVIGGFLITGLGLNASSAIISVSGGNFIAIHAILAGGGSTHHFIICLCSTHITWNGHGGSGFNTGTSGS